MEYWGAWGLSILVRLRRNMTPIVLDRYSVFENELACLIHR